MARLESIGAARVTQDRERQAVKPAGDVGTAGVIVAGLGGLAIGGPVGAIVGAVVGGLVGVALGKRRADDDER
jgi:hypothetical protein